MIEQMDTIYEIVCHSPAGGIERLARKHYRRYSSAEEAIQALGTYLTSGSCGVYAVEESRVEYGEATVDSSHASASFPTERVHARRAVARAVPLTAATLGATLGVLSFRVRALGPEATAAGMLVGDQVTRLGGLPIEDAVALRDALEQHQPGEIVQVEVEREGQALSLTLKLAEGEACGRYALEVLSGVEAPRAAGFARVSKVAHMQIKTRPLRGRR